MRLAHEAFGGEEGELCGHGVLVPAFDLFALGLEGEGEGELGTDTIAIRSDVADDTETLERCDRVEDTIEGITTGTHGLGLSEERSISSSMERIRLPRSTEVSSLK
ncbi:MAG: hypothetical protein RI897_3148 [Verrucomicrobiota bacterium]